MMTPARPLNVLYIIDYWAEPAGTERHLAYLIGNLDATRFRCSVAAFHFQPNILAERAQAMGIEVAHFPVARYYTPNALFQGRKLFKFIRARKIDIVQTFHYKSDIYGALIARFAGVRHIVSSKRDTADYKGMFRFFMHRLVRPITEKYIAVSEGVAQVIRNGEGVSAERISVIHNGVDLTRYSVPDIHTKEEAKRRLGFTSSDYVIGMSAWTRPEKDHQFLLDAYLLIAREAPNAKLVLLGDGPLSARYRQWIDDKGLGSVIKLPGAVEDVRDYLAAFDVACLVPRLNEGFSNSILEKMATGLPLVVTDVGGNREAIEHGINGFVIKPGDRGQLVKHLLTLHHDKGLRSAMGAASRQRVEQLFSLQSMVHRHADLYEALLVI